MTQTTAAPRALATLCDIALATTAVAVAVLPLSAFARYEVPQLALATLAGAVAAVAWLRAAFAQRTLVTHGSTWTLLLVLACIGFAFGRALFSPSGDAWESVALLWLLVPFALVALAPPSQDTGRITLYAVTAALVAAALASIAQRAGLAIPEAIPFTTHATGFGRAFFDDAATAGTWFALSGLAAATLAHRRGLVVVATIATLAGAIGVGLAGAAVPVAVFAGGLLLNLATSAERGPKTIGAALLGVVLATAATFVPPAETEPERRNVQLDLLETGQSWPLDDEAARDALRVAERTTAQSHLAFGAGPGRYSDMVLPQLDHDADYALAHTDGRRMPHRGVSPALEWTVEFGLLVPLLVLLLIGLVGSWRGAEGTLGVRLAAIALVVAGTSGVSPAFVVALGLVLLAAAPKAPASPESSPLPAIVMPLLAAGLTLLAMQPNAMRWGYYQALTANYAGNDQFEAAFQAARSASAAQTRAITLSNLGALTLLTTEPENRPVESALPPLRQAMDIARGAPIPRYVAARAAVRRPVDSPEQMSERTDEAARLLFSVVERDPNFLVAYEEVANILLAAGRTEEALEILEQAVARPVSAASLAPLNMRLGNIHDNFTQDPVKALVGYQSAAEGFTDTRRRGNAAAQVQRMEQWIETGNRPLPQRGHDDHAGHGHDDHAGHGHDGEPHPTHDGEPAGAHDGEPAGTHDGESAGAHDGEPAGAHDGEPAGAHDGEPAGEPAGAHDGEPAGAHDDH